jgi:hypothetical protein
MTHLNRSIVRYKRYQFFVFAVNALIAAWGAWLIASGVHEHLNKLAVCQ